MTWYQYAILIASPLFGGFVSLTMRHKKDQNLRLMLAFSGSFLFATVILHLLPDLYESHHSGIAIWVLFGFLLQLVLEQFTRGVEHGHLSAHSHSHNHNHHVTKEEDPITSFYAASVLFGLSVHSIIEGLPLNNELTAGHNSLYIGIVLHKIPAAFVLMSLANMAKMKPSSGYFLVLLYAVMTPFGALISEILKTNYADIFNQASDVFLALAVGSFFHISTTIMMESAAKNHRLNFLKFIAIVTGSGLAYLVN